jgi:hypothetical protein
MIKVLWFGFFLSASVCGSVRPSMAAEGATAAGPIGGSDIRSALLPPPGFYGGIIGASTAADALTDGSGRPIAVLDAVNLKSTVGGAMFLYVPELKILGGSIGLFGFVLAGPVCGQLVSAIPSRCASAVGDPYFEISWSRSFGQMRLSQDPGAFPIMEGLIVGLGLGAVVPIGYYDAAIQATNGVSVGNKTFDVAPSVAFTYTTPPLIAEGTEFSTKVYVNNYDTNPVTDYRAGAIVDVDFAISEHIGRWQVGAAGVYLHQIADDRLAGSVVPPDGRQLESLALGGVVNYDIAGMGAAIKFKALTTVLAQNTAVGKVFVISLAKKLF